MNHLPKATVTDSGFRLTDQNGEVLNVEWTDVLEIVAYKRDVWAYDVICLGFRVDGCDNFIEVAEEFPGYKQLVDTLQERFELLEDWWRTVAFPAFVGNRTTIWRA